MERELAREVEALYALPPAEFTAARNARARELKGEQPELAAQLAKLAKPTAAAAAVNRLARDEPSEVRALVQSGRRLREAQEAALSGKGESEVAGATREHREALDRVRREARRLELSDAVLERVAGTLRAASLDPELQPLLERGLLAREVEAAGFGLDPGLVAAAPPPRKRASKQPTATERRRAAAALKEAQQRLRTAKRELAAAEKERARIVRELDAAERDVERAEAAVADAQRAVDDARERA
jgi:hypothetical protein